ncbi:hypothetical protein ACHAWF_015078 [Thalassiosira exigua]
MRNKHRRRVAEMLQKKQRRLGDFLNLTLVMSYGDDGGVDGDVRREVGTAKDVGEDVADEDGDALRYYQGFHDVGSVVLSALGGTSLATSAPSSPARAVDARDDVYATADASADADPSAAASQAAFAAEASGLLPACRVLLRLSRSHLRDALRPDFAFLRDALRLTILPLIASFDAEVHAHLVDCGMEYHFCLSWVLTWFAHDLRDTELVKRLYDFFLVSHPIMAVYVSVAMVIHPLNRIEVLGADCDFACVHAALADLPKNSCGVGWRYLPGEGASSGYVSGEEDDGSFDASLQDQSLDGNDGGASMAGGQRVPFQELIDLSLSLMHKIPPRHLKNLAQRFHEEVELQPLLVRSSTIALLQSPPSWALASHVDSDWVLRRRLIEGRSGGSPKRLKLASGSDGQGSKWPDFAKEPPLLALVASGTGPDGRAKARMARRRRRAMVRGAAGVAALAVLVALARSYLSRPLSVPPPMQSASQRQQTRDALLEDNVTVLLSPDDPAAVECPVDHAQLEDSLVAEKSTANNNSALEDGVAQTLLKDELDQEQSVEDSGEGPVSPEDLNQLVASCTDDEAEEDGSDVAAKMTDGNQPRPSSSEAMTGGSMSSARSLQVIDEQQPSSSIQRDTLRVLLRSSVLFVKNLTTIHNNFGKLSTNLTTSHYNLGQYLRLDQLELHFKFIINQLAIIIKAGWCKVAPVLAGALQVGWRQIKRVWLKIAPVAKKELSLELEGGSLEWGEEAMKTWKKREVLLRRQGRLVRSFVSDVRKLAKVGKKSLADD